MFNSSKKHKVITTLIIAIIAVFGYYYYQNQNSAATVATRYVLDNVARGAIFTSISGSGQVAALDQFDVKPKVTADILTVAVKAGQTVKAGDVIATLNTTDLSKQVTNAKKSLDTAQINLNLKTSGLTKEDLAVAKNSLASSKMSYDNASANIDIVKKNNDDGLQKAELAVSDAQSGLDVAQQSYDNTVASKGITTTSDNQGLINTYENAKSTINSERVTLRSDIVSADSVLWNNDYSGAAMPDNYRSFLGARDSQSLSSAQNAYSLAKGDMESLDNLYNTVSSNWTQDGEDQLLNKTLIALGSMKTLESNLYDVLTNSIAYSGLTQSTIDSDKSSASSQESSLVSAISSVQGVIQNIASTKLSLSSSGLSTQSSLAGAKTSLDKAKSSLTAAQTSLEQTKRDNQNNLDSATSSLASQKLSYDSAQAQYNLKVAPPRAIDIATLKIQISQAQDSYNQAVNDFNSATVKAPFDGLVAKVYQVVGASASPTNPIITLITANKQVAVVTLNEVDAAKVKVGQRATVTFNAIDSLSISGEVSEIESIGTITQGVVNYTVKIAFDTEDARVKPQMSTSAIIITNEKLDTLMVSNSAISADNSGASYVQVPDQKITATGGAAGTILANTPQRKPVEIGLSNDTSTEILSGLNEGDQIIIRAISGAKTTAAPAAGSSKNALQSLGGGVLGGGGGRGGN
jgi:multidrug efflux pump subunit AcrA (membrane-fusion protein)